MLEGVKAHININLADIPEDGKQIAGSVEGAALLEPEEGDVRGVDAVNYDLFVQVFDGRELVARGNVGVPLSLRCVRCLRVFPYTLRVEVVLHREVPDDAAVIDLAAQLREELLLELPTYPKCELANLECEIHDIRTDFGLDKTPESGVECGAAGERSVWDALDGISTHPTP